jgi:hypothetical protein
VLRHARQPCCRGAAAGGGTEKGVRCLDTLPSCERGVSRTCRGS